MSASQSKSAATTTTSTATTDNRVAADGNSVVLGAGARYDTLADDVALKAIDAATELGSTGAKLAATLNLNSLDFARSIADDNKVMTGKTLDTISDVTGDNAQLAEALSQLAVQNVTKTANPDLATSGNLITAGAVVVGLGVIAYALKK
jgi:hypothetical protein